MRLLKVRQKWLTIFAILVLVIVLGRTMWQLWEVHTLRSIVASQTGCVAPCWRGLQPQKSTEQDIVDWLDSRGKKDFGRIRITEDSYLDYVTLDAGSGNGFIRLWKDDGNLITIEIVDKFPKVTLRTILSEMGPPDTFGAQWLMDLHATHVGRLLLFYEDEGVVFQSSFIGKLPSGSVPDDCLINIKPDITFLRIHLTRVGASHEMLQYAKYPLSFTQYMTIQEWHGIGMQKIDRCDL